MTDVVHGDVAAIRELRGALEAFLQDATDALADAMRAAARVLEQIEAEVAGRRAALEQLTAELEACERDERADCSGLARAVARASERLERALQARRAATQALARFSPHHARFKRECQRLVGEGRGLLTRRSEDLERYLSGGGGGDAGRAGGSSAGVGGSAAGGPPSVMPGMPDGWAMVPLASIDTSDSQVVGGESFGKGYAPADLAWAFEALHEVVLPAMARGRGADYFQQRDAEEGRVGARSYSDTYSGFFGDSAIKLESGPAGTFTVGNGHHRIWVAKQLGLSSVPGRLR